MKLKEALQQPDGTWFKVKGSGLIVKENGKLFYALIYNVPFENKGAEFEVITPLPEHIKLRKDVLKINEKGNNNNE